MRHPKARSNPSSSMPVFLDFVDPLNGSEGFNLDSRPRGRMVAFLTVFSSDCILAARQTPHVFHFKENSWRELYGDFFYQDIKAVKKLIKTMGNVTHCFPTFVQ
jgi:hypothetical protein